MGFILFDFKKNAERKELKKLVPTIDDEMDDWIKSYGNDDETPPTEEECAALEDEQISKCMATFDEEAAKLKRVADEVPKRRELLERNMNKKRGKLYRKFSGTLSALMEQATAAMNRCMEELEGSEEELKMAMPTSDAVIESEFNILKDRCTEYIERTYPEGVAGLDNYDEGLPDPLPTFDQFLEMIEAKKEEYKQLNVEAIPTGIDRVKAKTMTMCRDKANEAIQKVMAEIEEDLSDDVLPYLSEDDMAALRTELIDTSKEYLTSRLDTEE